jgi:S1-C subfamily serine protease
VDFTSVLAGSTFDDAILQAMARGCVSVIEIQKGSPADLAGLRKGQVITQAAGKPVRTPDDFARAVEGQKGPVVLQTDRGAITVK